MRPKIKLATLCALTSLLIGTQSFAAELCSCTNGAASVNEAYQKSTAAFIGRVESVTKSVIKDGFNEVHLAILDKFKGLDELKTSVVVVYSRIDPRQCGVEFLGGQDYLIFATGNPAGLKVDTCLGSGVLDAMLAQLDELQRITGRSVKKEEKKVEVLAPRKKPSGGLRSDMYFELGPDSVKKQRR